MREETLKQRCQNNQNKTAVKTNFINYAMHEFKGPLRNPFSARWNLLNHLHSLYEEENGELPYFSEHFRRSTKHLQAHERFFGWEWSC